MKNVQNQNFKKFTAVFAVIFVVLFLCFSGLLIMFAHNCEVQHEMPPCPVCVIIHHVKAVLGALAMLIAPFAVAVCISLLIITAGVTCVLLLSQTPVALRTRLNS
ncbi:MAG: hypothetical protein FWD49_05725 [Firmicutes bacterium]|nr:hypothetical protein [Bacillota bacterium]